MSNTPDGYLSQDTNWKRLWFAGGDAESMGIVISKITSVTPIGPDKKAKSWSFYISVHGGEHPSYKITAETEQLAREERNRLLVILDNGGSACGG